LRKSTFKLTHFKSLSLEFGNQECRNVYYVGHSMGMRQAFRSSFFTNYDIMYYLNTSHTVLGMLSFLLRLLWLIATLSFLFQCPESAAKWILKVL
jgi:uncharacterized membrane protein YkgB